MKSNSRLSWGVTFVFFGLLFLMKVFNFLPADFSAELFNPKNFIIYIGIIFFLFYKNRNTGLVLLAIGVLLRLPDFIRITHRWAHFLLPILFVVIGIFLIFSSRDRRG